MVLKNVGNLFLVHEFDNIEALYLNRFYEKDILKVHIASLYASIGMIVMHLMLAQSIDKNSIENGSFDQIKKLFVEKINSIVSDNNQFLKFYLTSLIKKKANKNSEKPSVAVTHSDKLQNVDIRDENNIFLTEELKDDESIDNTISTKKLSDMAAKINEDNDDDEDDEDEKLKKQVNNNEEDKKNKNSKKHVNNNEEHKKNKNSKKQVNNNEEEEKPKSIKHYTQESDSLSD